MGFTIDSYQLCDLPALPNIYVSIHGSFTVKKSELNPAIPAQNGLYLISFEVFYQAGPETRVITSEKMSFSLQALPTPSDLFTVIYSQVKTNLDPKYGTSEQTLVFTDDNVSRKRIINQY